MREIRIDENSLNRNGKKGVKQIRDVEIPSGDMGFQVNEISSDDDMEEEIVSEPIEEREPGELVKVRFDKFVQLVATHNFEEVLKNHAEEDIVMNSNLLMDLASAHEDTDDSKKQSMMIGVGVLIGLGVALVLLKLF
ncbi:MAG: hypothetical protein NTX63_00770 [Candidatus Peregrinibacteria bacterium]|nr:hypothetical protein [Candidatus Peregrinibacteria bacterium]